MIADDFSRTRWNIWAEFSIFRKFIRDRDKILDAGCGNGRLIELLRNKKIDYTGIDFSEGLIEIAKKKYPGYKFLVGNILSLPFPDNYFDVVLSVAVLHHIPSNNLRMKAIQEARRVLKKNGKFILTVWDVWGKRNLLLLVLRYSLLKLLGKSKLDFRDVFVPWGKKTNRYYHFFTKKEIEKLVKRNGFRVLSSGIAKNETGRRSNIYVIAERL